MEYQMRGKDAAAGHRRDVCYLRENAGVAQESRQPEMVQTRPEPPAGQRETDLLHEWLMHCVVSTASVGIGRCSSGPKGSVPSSASTSVSTLGRALKFRKGLMLRHYIVFESTGRPTGTPPPARPLLANSKTVGQPG